MGLIRKWAARLIADRIMPADGSGILTAVPSNTPADAMPAPDHGPLTKAIPRAAKLTVLAIVVRGRARHWR